MENETMNLDFLLVLAAAICTGLAAFGVATRIHLGWAGVTLFLLSVLI